MAKNEDKDRKAFEKAVKEIYGGKRIDWTYSWNPLLIFSGGLAEIYVADALSFFLAGRESMREELKCGKK